MQCPNKAIKAHSVQNSRVLDLLSKDGHVIQLQWHFEKDNQPEMRYKSIGRNKATTFTGLCSDHDREIFREIDTKEIDVSDECQLFLLAYRSVLRELHATMDAAVTVQTGYQKRVELGIDPENEPSDAGIEAVYQMAQSWRTFRYKCKYDDINDNSNYKELINFIRVIKVEQPAIAASVFFGIGKYTGREDIIGVTVNVVPQEERKTLIIVSYLKEHRSVTEEYLSKLFIADGHYFNYLLSKLLLKHGENFVINPNYYEMWLPVKKEKIQHYFQRTLFDGDHDEESEHFYLF